MNEQGAWRCDICASGELDQVYTPIGTQRQLNVYYCRQCGLLQSLPRGPSVIKRSVNISAAANWGNVRYGKVMRVNAGLALLQKHKALNDFATCLDVGASRGGFIKQLMVSNSRVTIDAIEPDESVTTTYRNLENVRVLNERVEKVDLRQAAYDLIVCSHTLEHLSSPLVVLRKLRTALKTDGVMLLEVPNVSIINSRDIVEEWFIDKHLYHYSAETFMQLIRSAGLKCIKWVEDAHHLTALVVSDSRPIETKNDNDINFPVQDTVSPKQSITAYAQRVQQNRIALQRAAVKLSEDARQFRVAIWGAGRILDCLVRYGGLRLNEFACVVDKYLTDFHDSVHGVKIFQPGELKRVNPDVIVIMSREFAEAIRSDIKALGLRAQVVAWQSYLEDNCAQYQGVARAV